MQNDKSDDEYKVLSPWADADPVPMTGLTAPRLTGLNGKKIGLFHNIKRAGPPILRVIEHRLKERYPGVNFSWYSAQSMSVSAQEPQNKDKFAAWIAEVDAVILAVAD